MARRAGECIGVWERGGGAFDTCDTGTFRNVFYGLSVVRHFFDTCDTCAFYSATRPRIVASVEQLSKLFFDTYSIHSIIFIIKIRLSVEYVFATLNLLFINVLERKTGSM
jgi:hypothetical protein